MKINVLYESLVFNFIITALLLHIAIYNGYPLLTPDSGSYVDYAFNVNFPFDRPVFYSLFIQLFSFKNSLWLVVILQSLIVSFLIWHILKQYLNETAFYIRLIIAIIFSLFSGISWYVSQIMPDIFTPILFFSFIVFFNNNGKVLRFILINIIVFSIICHSSNLIISTLFLVFSSVLFFINRTFKKNYKIIFFGYILVLMSWLIASFTNYKVGYGLTPNPSSHVFLMGKLSENGLLKTYLEDHCDKKPYKLCPFKNELPNHAWDFIWQNDGAFAKSGAWGNSKTEYDEILKGTIKEPKYIILHIKESFKATIAQIQLLYVGDGLSPQRENSGPFQVVNSNFKSEINQFKQAKQYNNSIQFDFFNGLYQFSMIIVIVFSLVFIFLKTDKKALTLFFFGVGFVLINAFTTASFANVLARLNSRAIYIMVLIGLIIITKKFIEKSKVKTKIVPPPDNS